MPGKPWWLQKWGTWVDEAYQEGWAASFSADAGSVKAVRSQAVIGRLLH